MSYYQLNRNALSSQLGYEFPENVYNFLNYLLSEKTPKILRDTGFYSEILDFDMGDSLICEYANKFDYPNAPSNFFIIEGIDEDYWGILVDKEKNKLQYVIYCDNGGITNKFDSFKELLKYFIAKDLKNISKENLSSELKEEVKLFYKNVENKFLRLPENNKLKKYTGEKDYGILREEKQTGDARSTLIIATSFIGLTTIFIALGFFFVYYGLRQEIVFRMIALLTSYIICLGILLTIISRGKIKKPNKINSN